LALFKPVSALQRGLGVLSVVSRRGRVRVTDVCEETGLDKATIIRMLETLVHEGYVEKYPADATYAVTGRTVDLGRGFRPHARMAELAIPLMEQFRARIGWPSEFAVPDGDAMFMIETGEHPLTAHRPVGFRPDFLLSSLGRAYLAFCADEDQRRLLDKLSGTTAPEAKNLLRNMTQLRAFFVDTRKQGYATADLEYSKRLGSETILSMAVPVTDRRRIYGAVSLFFVRSSISEEEAVRNFLPRLETFTRRLMKQIEGERAGFPSGAYYEE
jgi:IclR family transcriptional regulator, mhp operon transcriptional activator